MLSESKINEMLDLLFKLPQFTKKTDDFYHTIALNSLFEYDSFNEFIIAKPEEEIMDSDYDKINIYPNLITNRIHISEVNDIEFISDTTYVSGLIEKKYPYEIHKTVITDNICYPGCNESFFSWFDNDADYFKCILYKNEIIEKEETTTNNFIIFPTTINTSYKFKVIFFKDGNEIKNEEINFMPEISDHYLGVKVYKNMVTSLVWEQFPSANKYIIEADSSPLFSNPIVIMETNSTKFNNLVVDKEIYLRVTAYFDSIVVGRTNSIHLKKFNYINRDTFPDEYILSLININEKFINMEDLRYIFIRRTVKEYIENTPELNKLVNENYIQVSDILKYKELRTNIPFYLYIKSEYIRVDQYKNQRLWNFIKTNKLKLVREDFNTSSEKLKPIIKEFMLDIYNNIPKDMNNIFTDKVTEKMLDIMLVNNGFPESKLKMLKRSEKKTLSYLLEELWLYKGSKYIYELLRTLFKLETLNVYELYLAEDISEDGKIEFNGKEVNRVYFKPVAMFDDCPEEPEINYQTVYNKTIKYLVDEKYIYDYRETLTLPIKTNIIMFSGYGKSLLERSGDFPLDLTISFLLTKYQNMSLNIPALSQYGDKSEINFVDNLLLTRYLLNKFYRFKLSKTGENETNFLMGEWDSFLKGRAYPSVNKYSNYKYKNLIAPESWTQNILELIKEYINISSRSDYNNYMKNYDIFMKNLSDTESRFKLVLNSEDTEVNTIEDYLRTKYPRIMAYIDTKLISLDNLGEFIVEYISSYRSVIDSLPYKEEIDGFPIEEYGLDYMILREIGDIYTYKTEDTLNRIAFLFIPLHIEVYHGMNARNTIEINNKEERIHSAEDIYYQLKSSKVENTNIHEKQENSIIMAKDSYGVDLQELLTIYSFKGDFNIVPENGNIITKEGININGAAIEEQINFNGY